MQPAPYICNLHKEIKIQYASLSQLMHNNHCCSKCISIDMSKRYRKYTFEQLKNMFQILNCILISEDDKYKNQNSKLCFICNKHKNKGIQEINITSIEKGATICFYCRDTKSTRLPLSYIKENLFKKHLILLNNTYENVHSELYFICELHKEIGEQNCTYLQFKNSDFVCEGCKVEEKERKRLEKEKIFFNIMILEGLIPTFNAKYFDRSSKIKYTCVKHPNIIQTITKVKFDIGRRCRQCGIDKNSGSNHYNYQGGISALNNYLRGLLRPLIDDKLKEYNYKCFITGKNGTLEVHHLYNFNKIVKDTLKELNFKIKDKVEDYSEDEINKITKLFLDKHEGKWGIPILLKLHDLFHKTYGLKDNNRKQFYKFVEDYNNGLY